jgi:hypothetical protein
MESEFSESGSPIYRHQPSERSFDPVSGNERTIEAISNHIERWIGKADWVWHELVSDRVHIDVHVVPPQDERDYFTLITSGMSDLPMKVPEGCEDLRFAELMICLPSDWRLHQDAFSDENNYWPIRWLKLMARMPHEYDSWLAVGHTVPNGDPPQPFASRTPFCCMLVAPCIGFGNDFPLLNLSPQKAIHFYNLLPLYQEEMEYKLKHGFEGLIQRWDNFNVTEVVDIHRPNTCLNVS